MSIFDAAILGIVEGITEFLPISSTGHLILTSELLHITQSEYLKSFEIAIQLGAILSVIVLYFKKFLQIELLKKLFVAFLPTAVIGLLLYKVLKTYLLGNDIVVLTSLFLGGIALIGFELLHQKPLEATADLENISYRQSFLIGLCQSVAIIPGVSRSAATIIGGLFLGLERKTIVEFSFLLAVPTMLAATGLDLIKNAGSFSASEFGTLAVGFVVSFIVALGSIAFLLRFIQKNTFIPFGIYRIVAALLFFFFVMQ